MKSKKTAIAITLFAGPTLLLLLAGGIFPALQPESRGNPAQQGLNLSSRHLSGALEFDGFYYETADRTDITSGAAQIKDTRQEIGVAGEDP